MLYFKEAGRHKYAREALCFQADQYALLGPCEAYRQLWNRGFNTHGGEGNNIPLDLMLEHCNNYLKDMIHHQGANVSFHSPQTASRVAKSIQDILLNFDTALSIKPESGHHSISGRKRDVAKVAKVVLDDKLICKSLKSRAHGKFPKFPPILAILDPTKLWRWVKESKTEFNRLFEHP